MMNEMQKEKRLQAIQLSNKLTDAIRADFKEGDMLPPQGKLAEKYEVSTKVLRDCLEILETTGVIRRVQGKGAVVLQQQIGYPIYSYTRFSEILKKNGRKSELKVLRKIGIPADEEVSKHLKLDLGEPVIMLECLGKMDGAPFTIGHQYLPFEKMYDVMHSYTGDSLHAFIRARYNIKLRRVLSLITAHIPSERDCEILEISTATPLLQVKSVNVDEESGEPVEYVETRFKSTSIELSFDLSGDIIR